MSINAIVVNVMIASPGDVKEERKIVRDLIQKWNNIHSSTKRIVLQAIGWETHCFPEAGGHPQTIVNKQIVKKCDLLIGIFRKRIGTPTENAISGSVEEIDLFLKMKRPLMLYFMNDSQNQSIPQEEQYRLLLDFKNKIKRSVAYVESYSSLDEFRDKVNDQLAMMINNSEYFAYRIGQYAANESTSTNPYSILDSLSSESKNILKEMAASSDGLLRTVYLPLVRYTRILTNGKDVVPKQATHRERTRWLEALHELDSMGLIERESSISGAYRINSQGFEVSDKIPEG